MAPYVTEVHLFYKLEYFQCSFQVTNETIKFNNKDKATVANERRKEKEDNTERSHKVQKSRYKPLYLFCDSLEKKFFLISLCAAPNEKNTNLYKRDYLILERYNWFYGPDQSDQVTISTTGIKSTVVEMEAGRQLLRIDGSPEFSLAIISSDTAFHFGNQTIVQQLMTKESHRTEQMSKIISDILRKAYQSFGTENYPTMLKDYYRSYMPSSQDSTLEGDKTFPRMLIHSLFLEEQVRLIMETFPGEEHGNILHSLRVFFLNPNIRLEYLGLTRAHDGFQDLATKRTSKISYSSKADMDVLDQAARKIQSFFKMALIKQYKYLHDSNHPQHMPIREELLKIPNLFDLSVTNQLLRNVIKRHSKLRDLYPCSKDFVHVLSFQEFNGTLENIKHDQWFPIARIIVNPRSSETVFAAFELLVDLPRFTLRVFSNQSQRDTTRLINRVTPGHYRYHPTGYTIFAYGWNGEQRFKEINWTIRIITMKGEPMFCQLSEQWAPSLEIRPPSLMVEELAAVYIPNARNYISRWILQTISRSIISLRLTTSYDMVEVGVRLTDEEGNVLINVDGGSTILVPLVILDQFTVNKNRREVKDRSAGVNEEFGNAIKENKLYYVEAFVRNNSWPLTDVEWTVVNRIKTKDTENLKIKMRHENKIPTKSNLATTKDTKRSVNDNQVLESPYWILQVVTNARDAIEICQDERREQEIALLKDSWRSKDPSQPERGRKLREAFLNTHTLIVEPVVPSEENEEESSTIETGDMAFCQSYEKQRRTLKPPKSYHLPALDLTKYMTRNGILTDYYIRMEIDYQILRDQQTVNIIESQKNYSHYLENLAELTDKQFRTYVKLFSKKEQNFWERRALVDHAYESRKVYIDTPTSSKAKIKEKDKATN
ncbi:PREDICTED: androglobin-like [Dinoponera quadriceps]|uniref:Androglobin-like n=1 Tax=Dinoponera quadriceps TaxID=609295 RepID=A0A6P3XV30_DINQU|nr:PREDICTED: androglobin-like [Dinoponera quadriceps]